jgi:hypothetical protein
MRDTSFTSRLSMKHNKQTLWMARVLALLLLASLVLLVAYLPFVAAILFVALCILFAVVKGKAYGFWSGMRFFLKEIFFGW